MRVQIEKLPKSKVELRIEVSVQEFERSKERAISDLARSLAVKGFRKGRVPEEIIEREVGTGEILNKTAEIAIQENYARAVLEQKIEAISPPEVEILKLAPGNPFEFKVRVQVLPSVVLPDYKSIASKVKKQKPQVSQEEAEEALSWLQKSRAKFSSISRPAKKGDFVEIEFSSPQIGKGKEHKDRFILGEGQLIPGFEDNLEGMEAGQEKSFTLTFPKKHFQKDLSGGEADFKVKMVSVQEVEFPEINDQFAKSLGRFENLTKLKESIKEGILREKAKEESSRVRQEALKNIVKKTKCELPEVLVAKEKTMMVNELKQRVSQELKMDWEDYCSSIKKTEEEVMISFSAPAEERVKEFLTLRELSKQEGIEVSEEEVLKETNKILRRYPSVERAKNDIDLERLRDYTKEVIRNNKTLARLESFATKQ